MLILPVLKLASNFGGLSELSAGDIISMAI